MAVSRKLHRNNLLNKKRPLVVASAVRHSMVWVVSRLDLVQDPTWAADSWQARPFCACALDRHAMRCPTSQYLEEHRRMWNFEFLDPHSGVPVAWFLFTTNATGQHRRRGVFPPWRKDWGGLTFDGQRSCVQVPEVWVLLTLSITNHQGNTSMHHIQWLALDKY